MSFILIIIIGLPTILTISALIGFFTLFEDRCYTWERKSILQNRPPKLASVMAKEDLKEIRQINPHIWMD